MHEAYSFPEGVVADVRELPFDASTFDIAFDKGGIIRPIPFYVFDDLFQGRWMQ